ncbi:MAG: hypothetical protein K940chlam6_01648, partial [Chlamydiae bacterium]|nr:hypothetical protein [Chlamydiota bacterium]
PMLGFDGQFGQTVLGGMANILRVREGITTYEDPGPYHFPKETLAEPVTKKELKKNGIKIEN